MKRENRESRYHHALSEYNAKLTQTVTLRDALRDSERRMHVTPRRDSRVLPARFTLESLPVLPVCHTHVTARITYQCPR